MALFLRMMLISHLKTEQNRNMRIYHLNAMHKWQMLINLGVGSRRGEAVTEINLTTTINRVTCTSVHQVGDLIVPGLL